jgi:glycosyltransferase involved in cell wall biosynthesis
MAHCIGLKAPIVVNRRVDFPVRSRFKYNHPAVKRIICDSETIRRVMADCLGRGDKLVTVHSGIDVDRFTGRQSQGILRRDFGIPPDCRLIGNVAALADHKGYPTFIDTAEILLNQDGKLRFLIIGEGPQRAEIEARISQKNLQERIFITGFRSDIPDILPELDLFLITSKTEGLGTSIIEAMAARVPVVATAAGGIPELITDNLTGLLAPVGDSRALAAAALRVLREAGLKERLVAKALGVPPRFDKKEIGRKTWDIYQTIMS